MTETAFCTGCDTTPRERSADPREAGLSWHTLVSGDRTASQGIICGVAKWEPGGWLPRHRHAPPEIYFGLEGSGVVTIDGTPFVIGPGVTLYVPGNAWHETMAGPAGLRIFYTFPVHSFTDIVYEYASMETGMHESIVA